MTKKHKPLCWIYKYIQLLLYYFLYLHFNRQTLAEVRSTLHITIIIPILFQPEMKIGFFLEIIFSRTNAGEKRHH